MVCYLTIPSFTRPSVRPSLSLARAPFFQLVNVPLCAFCQGEIDPPPFSLPGRESSHHCLLFTVGEPEAKGMEVSELPKALSLVNRWKLDLF